MIVAVYSSIWPRRFIVLACLLLTVSLLFPAAAVAEPFTVVVLPDTQNYSQSFPTQFRAQTQWIVDRRSARNIVFVSHEGDVVQNGERRAEWNVADAAFGLIDASVPDLPYGVSIGNHDFPDNHYIDLFGASRYADSPWYGGSSPDQRNHYQRFTAGGRTFLNISLEWTPGRRGYSWAQGVLEAHPSNPTIITTHEYTAPNGARSGSGAIIFDRLVKDNPQVFMVLSGHRFGEAHQTVANALDQPVFEMLANYQNRTRGGDGWLRLLEFDEDNSQINVSTFSPTLKRFETDANSQFSFVLDFVARLGPAVPEPSTISLAALGLLFLLVSVPKRRSRRSNDF